MESMACKYREELVGKRFISVRSPVKLKIGKISEWEWRSGIVRAISSRDTSSLDLAVLIEFDDIDWTRREWIRVHDIFQLFLVEHTLVWAERPDPDKPKHSVSWPGLSFRAVVDKVGLSGCRRKPVEFLVDRFLGLVEEKEIQIFQEGDENSHPTACSRDEVRQGLKNWLDYQDGQKILLTTPTVLVGYRLEVYRAEGTTQWYTAVIQSYNHTTKTLSVVDDTVLEEHNEDPTLIQMHLIDDGVIDSILRGVEIGITPRRRPRAVNKDKEQPNSVSKSSASGTSHTATVSRAPVQRKPRPPPTPPRPPATPPQPPAVQTPAVTPTTDTAEKTETRSGDKSNPRLRQLTPRDRKRKADTPEEQDSSQSSPASRFRKRTKSEESKPQSPAKPHSKRDLTPSPASSVSESTPPLRVSPRTTPSKERVLKPTRTSTPTLRNSNPKPIQKPPTPKADVQRTQFTKVEAQRTTPKSEVQRTPTPKQEVHKPPTPKSEVSKPLTPKTDVRRTPTPKPEVLKSTVQAKEEEINSDKVKSGDSKVNANVNDLHVNATVNSSDLNKQKPKTRPKRETNKEVSADSQRNITVAKTQEQATPVIKPFSGSQKDKSEKNTSAKSEKVTEKSGRVNEPAGSSNTKPGKYNKNRTTSSSSDNINDQVEEKLKEIRTALCEKEKEKELERSKALVANDKKKGDKSVSDKKEKAAEKKTRKNERKKDKGKFNVDTESQGDTVAEKPPNKPSKERDKSEVSDDNMHYIKKKQLSQGGFISGPQNSGIASSNIDVNQSVTDQVARAEKLSSLHCEDKPGSTSSTLSSPNSDTNIDRSESRDIQLPSTQPRDIKVTPNSLNSVNNNNTNTNSSWSHDERSQSRASEERCSSGLSDVGEIRRPSSQADDLKSSKSSAASSPLIVDKSEPVLPYRDPELMSKNPVRSNVPNMHGSQNSYRSERTVHNPVPTAASRPASAGMMSSAPVTLSSSMSSSRTPVIPSVAYPSPLGLGHALPGNSLSSLLPPGLHQLDPATLAIHQQMAAVHQQQLTAAAALAQSQFQNALSMSYPVTLSSTQLEHLWQQKYPSVPVPPPWLLAKHQDDLLRDRIMREHEQLERERLDRIERDRERDRAERDRVERERKERDRRLEQERMEKERRERERREREKAEQERAERLEREKQLERERQRERLERERAERSRILKESVDSHAAVDQHFTESLRLASQKRAQTGIWPTPSITLGTGKPKGELQSLPSTYKPGDGRGEIKPEEKMSQEQLRENDFRHAEMMRMKQQDLLRQKEEYMRQHQQQMLQQHRNNAAAAEQQIKAEVKGESGAKQSGDVKPNMYGYQGKREPGSITTGMAKPEAGSANFSLYGYQPEKCTFMTAEQLHSYGLDTKSEKQDSKSVIRSQSPRRGDMSVPPPLIKDAKPQSSVIVENRAKEGLKSMSPHAHQQYTAHLHQLAGTPPHGQPKPAHTPERSHERPSPSSTSPGAAYHMNPHSIAQSHQAALKAEAARQQGVSRSQSPLHVASPQQLSAAVMQPMDYRCSPAGKSRTSPAATASSPSSAPSSNPSGTFTHAIAQPPVSLPQSVAFTYSLIQQGLVPNPIYTHNSPSSKTSSDSQRTVSVTGTARVPHAAHSPHPSNTSPPQRAMPQGQKRKGAKEGANMKRQKGPDTQGQQQAGNKALNLSVPVTTPQILTNQSPYTTSSSTTISAPSTTMAQSPMVVSQSGNASSISSAMLSNRVAWNNSGFMDSFKSFVETTVQNAFLSDPDLAKKKDGQILQQIQDAQQQQKHSNPQNIPQTGVPPRSKSSLERSSTPVTPQQQSIQPMNTDDVSNRSNSASGSTYSDTINRVANGAVDTDSDTLSAPSPPLQAKQDPQNSPHKSAKHPNLKKAWLQRHSDEDKQEAKPPVVAATHPLGCPINPAEMDTDKMGDKEKDKDVLKNCYVNCSYISPSKEGGSKSPISAIQTVIPNGPTEKGNIDESTTSASETETQAGDNGNPRKRVKVKKERNPVVKKLKVESDDAASNFSTVSNSGQGKKKNNGAKKNKDSKIKYESEEDVKPQIKQEPGEPGASRETPDAYQFPQDDPEPSVPIKEEKPLARTQEEPMDYVDAMDGQRKTEKKDKKVKKEKKDRKIKKEKDVSLKEEDQEQQHELLPLPKPILKETELKAQQSTTFSKPLVRAPMSALKKSCEPFIQDGSCSEVTPKLMKCRECKMTPTQKNQTIPNIFCRFYAFRRLRYSQRGFLTIDGFSELTDAEQDDIDPWIPKSPIIPPDLDIESAKFIVKRVGEKFCELVEQEKEASKSAGEDAKVAWKRAVTGVREMCDVCDTTLFNMHWVCHKCGFVVCLDCYKVKAREMEGDDGENVDDTALKEEQREWLTCSANKLSHDHDKLMLTQIIPSDALWQVNETMHAMREKWSIKHNCTCASGKAHATMKKNGIKPNLVDEAVKQMSPKKKLVNGIGGEDHSKKTKNAVYHPYSSSPLSLLADVASMDSHGDRERSNSPVTKGKHGKSYTPITEPVSPGGSGEKKMPASCSTLRELLTKTAGKGGKVKNNAESKKKSKNVTSGLDDVIKQMVEKQIPKDDFEQVKSLGTGSGAAKTAEPMKLMHYTPRAGASSVLVRDTPILKHNLTETSVLYPDVPHSWLCDGRLLRLHDPKHRGNLKIFMEQWRRGQPVLVSGADKNMNINLWTPEYFSRNFGEIENDLVNCRTSCVVVGHPMKHFWDGFGVTEERLIDEDGVPMLLKLKDWPPSDDFSDLLPNHFQDLMDALPLPEYTRRDGYLNLASRLPDFLVKPDLGPKMYIAYGSAQYPKEGTTNLHLDVSDAANVMVHVGFMEEEITGRIKKGDEALKAIDKAGCDTITKKRVREVREVPGALWHIFDAVDADKIRDFLNKVGKERGEKIEQHHDPIHDQSWYLDEELQERLAKEYDVHGYTIIQCLGDTIFVPAGAPHQVRNLNNCIKVAEDFVSPEHLHHCFRMTQEFRHLSEGHTNHEDKLQVKNIIYHAVKDAVAVLNDTDMEDSD